MQGSKPCALPLGDNPSVKYESARRDSNPRPSPWQGDALPLSHSRIQRLKESNSQFSLWRRTLYHLTKPLYMLSPTNNMLSQFFPFVNYFLINFSITHNTYNYSYNTSSQYICREMYSKIQPAYSHKKSKY